MGREIICSVEFTLKNSRRYFIWRGNTRVDNCESNATFSPRHLQRVRENSDGGATCWWR
jgi:hypothetical protein